MEDKKSYQEILWPVLLILLLGICFVFTTRILWRFTRDECYYEIEQSASEAASTLRYNLNLYQSNLELVARLLTTERLNDTETLQSELELFCSHQQIDAVCVQLRDGRLICGGSTLPDYSVLPSFAEIAQKAPCVSGRFPGVPESGAWFLYQAVPIQSDGEVIAILYGLMDLNQLPSSFAADMPFGGAGQLCLVDGDTGDVLMDTWRGTLGNLYDGSMEFGQVKSGYSMETMQQDLQNGQSGYIVFSPQTTGKYFYTRYQPVGINNWSINLTVPECVAFSEASGINQIIFFLGAVVTIITAFYLFITLRQYRRRLRLKQSQIQQTTFMFQVQQILFDAHQNPDLMVEALKKVAEEVEAEGTFLLTLHGSQVHRISLWRREHADFVAVAEENDLKQEFPQVYQHLLQNRSVLFCEGESNISFSSQELERMHSRRVHSMMITPVLDIQGTLYGVLCAVNFKRKDIVYRYVECVANSFIMAMCNMESYQLIHTMGTMDTLTGLKNRNSYESALLEYGSIASDNFHCIYVDVNGLHELNNQYGHKAGDTMLRFVANSICSVFGTEHTYRIGGDEFVAFSLQDSSDIVAEKLKSLCRMVETKGYYISVGSACWQDCERNLDELIAQAEEAMYDNKRDFYQKHDRRGVR
ncbi:diguanylate cyclase domain-containing protein [Agathobaculum sp. Marseille-P7918]|uniref:diguanylate cyclase domain-containing protein n=1 Tax=Agathobaculum sp. Marseille-P7918 TaxID=2479843 RepID=UPI0035666BF3